VAVQAASLFELPRLMALLEWRAGKELEVSVATQIANLAYRRGAHQLLAQCVRFLALHLMCVQATGAVSDVEPAVSDMVGAAVVSLCSQHGVNASCSCRCWSCKRNRWRLSHVVRPYCRQLLMQSIPSLLTGSQKPRCPIFRDKCLICQGMRL
jgi:hypothetical protein